MKKVFFIFGFVCSFLCFCTFAQGGNPGSSSFQDFEELSLEDLLNAEVVTAAKKVQKISEAPAAMYVITDEDIKQSGATSIPEILRMVPGLDVMEISASDFVINARGFNKEMSNKMLVLIDGKSVYWDFYGLIVWDSFVSGLDEIKRIEIVKGPGSALYGANAFSGVINIVTKSPEELKEGTSFSTKYGSLNTTVNSMIHAGKNKNLGYKVSLGWSRANKWNDTNTKEGYTKYLNAGLDYMISETSKISLGGGYNDDEGLTMTGVGRMNRDHKLGELLFSYSNPNLWTQLWWRRVHSDVIQEITSDRNFFKVDIYDMESKYLFNVGSLHSVVLGGSYRFNVGRSDMVAKSFDQSLYAFYLQDELRPVHNLAITLGIRYDGHSLFKDRLTPRGNILLSPTKNHFLRFSYGQAFRNPSFIESYLSKDTDITSQLPPGLPPNTTVVTKARGNPHLGSEKITSYEVGYEALLSKQIKCKLDLFYNQLKDFVFFETMEYQDISYLLGLPANSVSVPSQQSYVNEGKATAKGFEFGLDVLVNTWLRGLANYSYQDIAYDSDNPATPENEKQTIIKSSPKHKINAGLRFDPHSPFYANLMMHHVSQKEMKEDYAYGKVDPYTLFNLSLGYTVLDGKIEASFSVFNLFNKKHFEYPGYDKEGNLGVGHRIGRRVTFGFLVNL